MSRYDWPRDIRGKERDDDPAARGNFLRRRHLEFDAEGALRAGRTAPQVHVPLHGVPIPTAPISGRQHLWQQIGPLTLLGGQADNNPRVSGRVNAISVHDGGQRAYAASANGGVWYTSDGGANWISVAGLAPTDTAGLVRPAQRNACGAILVVFGATAADDDVYVGTGETSFPQAGSMPNAQPGQSLGGVGILFAHGPVTSGSDNPWQREAKNLVGYGVNRIVIEPGGNTVIAATSIGLLQRPNPSAADNDWQRVAGTPFDSLNIECTDVLWTAANGSRPARLWVWVRVGDNAGLWVRDAGATNFEKVAVAGASDYGYSSRRAALAASTSATQIWVLNDRGSSNTPGLFRVTNPVTGPDRPQAFSVVSVPNVLRDQGFYDIAIAVDPAHPDRVALAGSYLEDITQDGRQSDYNASIVVADVAPNPANGNKLTYGQPTPYMHIGIGVHPDVHALAYSNGGATLWTCCDGGIFRSDNPTRPAGFYPRNNGLSISESDYIACHPICEGYIVAGLQDNGTIERVSSGVWRMVSEGDGGGVMFDPLRPDRFIGQYTSGEWWASDGTFNTRDTSNATQNNLLTRNGTFASTESDNSAFYSEAASIAQRRGAPAPATPNIGQMLIGTTRLWYTENFGAAWATPAGQRSWVTLPSGTDPLPANSTQDDFGEQITVCRWQSPDVAWVLGEGRLMRYTRTPGSDNGGGPGTWTPETIIKKNIKNKKDATSADGPIRDSSVWTDIAVNLDPPAAADQPPTQHGTKGAMYMGTIGKPDDNNVDTLWWFDGTSKWFKTDLRTDATGVPAPVTAIVCDPAFPDEVYVGTTVGVWKGVRTQIGNADPAWTWAPRVNGLPEAAVEDLEIFNDSARGLRLLRAAIAARGVWELRLDVPNVADLTYVRAHADDLRYSEPPVVSGTRVLKQRDLTTDRSWHGSPDVRPRVAPALVPAPASLVATPWRRTTLPANGTEQLRRFQAALRSHTGDPRVIANGKWDVYFSEVLRDHGAPTVAVPATATMPALNVVQINQAFWNTHMVAPHATAEPWGANLPSEADLYELTPKLDEGTVNSTSCALPARRLKVDIVVHFRGLNQIDGANVRVTLLWWADTRTTHAANWNDATTWFTGNVPWTAAVNQVLNSSDGKTNQAVGTGWHFALGNNTQSHRITLAGQTLDPVHSGVVTFDLDLTGRRSNSVVLLVAVIRAGTSAADDIALAPATLRELALTSPNVAVRSLRINP
jgi:hypothetical protein